MKFQVYDAGSSFIQWCWCSVSSQVTEKTDAYMDNLRVGLELWDKQLSLGGEVDSWAGAKLALFAESHPFHNQQHVSDLQVRVPQNSGQKIFENALIWSFA